VEAATKIEGKTPPQIVERRHHKAPLRGALMRLQGAARRAAAIYWIFLIFSFTG
jgi:hypothetical protein